MQPALWTPEPRRPILPPGFDPLNRVWCPDRRIVRPGERGYDELLANATTRLPRGVRRNTPNRKFASNAFDGSTVTGYRAEFNADAGLWQDRDLTTAATANNDPVGGWVDQSGNGLNALVASGRDSERLTLDTSGPNGHKCVKATGATKGLFSSGNVNTGTPWTIYAVVRTDTWNNVRFIVGGTTATATGIWHQGSSPQISNQTNALFVSLTVGTWGIVMTRSTGNCPAIRLNLGTEQTVASGTSGALNAVAILGDILSGHAAGDSAIASLARVIYYNASHGSTDQSTVINGLATWAGISV